MYEKLIEKIRKIIPESKDITINFTKREDGLEWGNIEFTTDKLNGIFTVGFLVYDIKSETFTLTASPDDIRNNLTKLEQKCQA